MAWIGFDIGGTKLLSACLCEESGRVGEVLRCPTPRSAPELLGYLRRRAEEYQALAGPWGGIGIGVAGVEREDGTLWTPNLPALDGLRLGEILSRELGLPVSIENDAHAALRGERWQGALHGVRNALLLAVGTGLGGALLLDGRVLHGAHGACGAAGWARVSAREGRYEQLASGTSLDCLARKNGFPDARALCQACREGHRQGRELFQSWAMRLGEGVAALASVLDVSHVVIAGGLSAQYDLFYPCIQRQIRAQASPLNQSLIVRRAELGELSCLYGAVRLSMEQARETN